MKMTPEEKGYFSFQNEPTMLEGENPPV